MVQNIQKNRSCTIICQLTYLLCIKKVVKKYSPIYITFVEINSNRSSGFAQSKGPPMAQSQFGNQNNLFGSTLQPQ